MSREWVPEDCIVCGACYGHEEDCGARARTKLRKAQADIKRLEEFSNTLATILPEDAETWPGVNPEAAQEAVIEAALKYLVAQVDLWKPKKPQCPHCGTLSVSHSSEHLVGGMNPGWVCDRP